MVRGLTDYVLYAILVVKHRNLTDKHIERGAYEVPRSEWQLY